MGLLKTLPLANYAAVHNETQSMPERSQVKVRICAPHKILTPGASSALLPVRKPYTCQTLETIFQPSSGGCRARPSFLTNPMCHRDRTLLPLHSELRAGRFAAAHP